MDDDITREMAVPEQLSYLSEHRVLICLLCRVGLRPGKAVSTHFRNIHQWKGEQLAAVMIYIATLQLDDPHTVELPPNSSGAIPELGKPISGYRCMRCGYLRRHKDDITTHLRKERHWSEGGDSWQRPLVQTFSHGRYARYWIVDSSPGERGEIDHSGEEARDMGEDAFQDMLDEYQMKYDAKRTRRREIADNPSGIENQSMWVREMGWAEHFEGKQKPDIYLASLMPRPAGARVPAQRRHDVTVGEVDPVLMRLGGAVDRIMQRCSARLKLVPHETLRWLKSIDPTKPAERPFTLKENEKSMIRYRQFMKRCLVYCSRAARLGRDEARRQHQIQWTDRQWTLLEQVNEELTRLGPAHNDVSAEQIAQEEAELERIVFQYLIAILQQQVAFNVYVNPLLHFAAVLGINDVLGRWAEPKHYTASLAGLVWCSRMLMLQEVFHDSPEDPNEVTVDMVEQFKAQQQRWLADGTHSPFSTMIRWMAYGKGFRTKEGGTAKVLWEDGGDTLRYLGQRIAVVDFVDAANAAVVDAETMLDTLMFGRWQDVQAMIDLPRIIDSLMFGGPDASFATDPRNKWLRPGFAFLAERARPSMWQKDGGWQQKKIPICLRTLKQFKRLLMVLIHIWAGQPGRGPELTKLKHCGTQQVPGNVFVFDGQVMIITDLDKSRSIRGLGRKVARFLPERIGKMVVAYVAWLIPFEEMLCDKAGITGMDATLSSYMWKDARKGAWETEQLSEALASLTGQHMGIELMVSDYRHVAIGLARKIKGIIIRRAEIEMGEQEADDNIDGVTGEGQLGKKMEYIWDAQATHGSVIAAAHYAVDMRFPNQLQPEKVAHFREISRLWHRFLERGGSQSSVDDVDRPSRKRKRATQHLQEDAAESKTVTMKQQEEKARKVRTAVVRRVKQVKGMTLSQPVAEIDIQRGLKQLLGPRATWKMPEQGEAVEAIMTLTEQQALMVVLPTGAGKSILFLLPALLEETGTNIVVVPFAALMDDLVNRARQAGIDCLRWKPARLQERELPIRAARLVVVSADVVEIEQFRNYMDGLRSRKLLKRIFFDEAHTAILDVSFRRRLEDLKGIHRYECPVIALTATMPGAMEHWFRRIMLMEHAEMIRASTIKRNIRYNVIRIERGETSSENGQSEQKRGKVVVEEEVVRVVLRMEKAMSGDQKGVVYCRSRSSCEVLAEKLGCDYHHSGVPEGQRQTRLKRWIEGAGDNRWIVATSGLGTGVDIKGIVGVVHMEQPYGIVDFVQQTGRGGRREGEVVESVVVMEAKKVRMDEKRSDVEQINHQAMECFVESSGCRRVILGVFLDVGLKEAGMDCEQLQAEICDRCQARYGRTVEEEGEEDIVNDEIDETYENDDSDEMDDSDETNDSNETDDSDETDESNESNESNDSNEKDDATSTMVAGASQSNRLSEYVKEKHGRLGEWRRWLMEVGDRCPVCYVEWVRNGRTLAWQSNTEHGIQECPRIDFTRFKSWQSRLDFGEYDCCWRCALPQSMCRGLQDYEHGSQGFSAEGCEWGNQIKPLLYWIRGDAAWRDKIRTEFRFVEIEEDDGEWLKQRAYLRWLGRTRRMYDEDMTNAIAVWDMIIREVWR